MSARIFLVRHGETEWSRGGKHTSTSEVPLSKEGEKQVERAREAFVGEGKLINPFDICRMYVFFFCRCFQRIPGLKHQKS